MNSGPSGLVRALSRLPSRAGLLLVRGYQRFVSPVLPASCRYHPTCSEYAFLAIGEWGLLRGGLLAAWRVLRCNPWSPGGFDMPPRRHPASRDAGHGKAGSRPAPPAPGRHVVTHGS